LAQLLLFRFCMTALPGGRTRFFFCLVFASSLLVLVPQAAFAEKPPQASKQFEELAGRAAAAREADRYDQAVDLYKKAVEINPAWEEGWWYLGTLYYDSDHYERAVPAFRKLVMLNPKLGTAWAMLGLCEFGTHDYQNSLIHLERGRALGLGGNEELANVTRYHQGLLLICKGEFEAASEMLSPLVARGGLSENLKVALGLALLRVSLLPTQLDPSKDALIHAAGEVGAMVAMGTFDQAVTGFQKLLNDYPGTPFAHYAYGSTLASLSNYEDAEREFRQEIKITPESALPHMQLAYIKLRLHHRQEALPFAQNAVGLAPQSFAAHYLLGRAMFELGDATGSIKELETARRLGPYSPEVRYSLVRAYSKANRKAEAERERTEFARLNAMLERQQQSIRQSYRTAGGRGGLEPHEVPLSDGSPK